VRLACVTGGHIGRVCLDWGRPVRVGRAGALLLCGRDRVLLYDDLDPRYAGVAKDGRCELVFAEPRRRKNAGTAEEDRHHGHECIIPKATAKAVGKAGLTKRATYQTLPHSLGMHLPEAGYDIGMSQEVLDFMDVSATVTYTHVLNKGEYAARSWMDEF
jgi:hypothetical protein